MHVTIVARAQPRLNPEHAPFAEGGVGARLSWSDEAACAQSAAALAKVLLEPLRGAASITIELRGGLGAGKTTFTRHLLRALGVQGRIKSPSYAVVEPYELADLQIWHFDFFRFADPREWEDAGFRDIFASPGLKLVEWPDQAAGLLPAPDICLDIAPASDDSRRVNCHSGTPEGRAHVLAWLAQDAPPGRPSRRQETP